MAPILTLNEYRLWVVFHQTYDLVTRCKENLFFKTEITDQQHLVLWLMEFYSDVVDGPITISDLAGLLFRSMNSTSSIINRMKKNGLIEKARDLPDERAIRLIMTPKARKILKECSKPTTALTKGLFSGLSDEEMKTLISMLRKIKIQAKKETSIEKTKADPELGNPQKIVEFLKKIDR
jgi:DNA-binding MarR family transcriptional regulator